MAWGDKGNNQGPWSRTPTPPPDNNDNNNPDIDEFARKLKEKFSGLNPGGGYSLRNFLLAFVFLLVVWMLNGFFKVNPEEQAVVLKFGEFARMADPGLNYHLPWPIESVQKEKVKSIRKVEVGFATTQGKNRRSTDTSQVLEENLMLTGDENIVDINFEVQWRVADIKKFIFNLRSQEDTVKAVGESAMREIIGKTPIVSALAEGKLAIEQETKKLMQHILDSYGSGVEIITVNMRKVDPPAEVIDAFRDVQTARADKERAQNEAEAYRNDIIPRARGLAERMIQDSEAYKKDVVARAQGDAARFISIYDQYKDAKDITKRRIYLDTMQEVMKGTSKIIMEKNSNSAGVVPYMALPELRAKIPPQPVQP